MKVKVREFFNVKLGDKIYQSGEEIDVTPNGVKYGRTIYHENQQYNGGDTLELPTELALHHAANIEVYKPQDVSSFDDDDVNQKAIKDAERES